MCYDDDRFIEKDLVNRFICSICSCVLCYPHSKQDENEHKFCNRCINQWLLNRQSCPVCRIPLLPFQLKPFGKLEIDILSKLRLRCQYSSKGCQRIETYENIEKHEAECEYDTDLCNRCNTIYNKKKGHTELDCVKIKYENDLKNAKERYENEIEQLNKKIDEESTKYKNEIMILNITQNVQEKKSKNEIELLNLKIEEQEKSIHDYEEQINKMKKISNCTKRIYELYLEMIGLEFTSDDEIDNLNQTVASLNDTIEVQNEEISYYRLSNLVNRKSPIVSGSGSFSLNGNGNVQVKRDKIQSKKPLHKYHKYGRLTFVVFTIFVFSFCLCLLLTHY